MNKFKSIAIAIVILAFAFFISKILIDFGQKEKIHQIKKASRKEELTVTNRPFVKEIRTSGRMFAMDRFDIYAEVNGIILDGAKPLGGGTFYKKGEIIFRIDDSIYGNQLKAKKSALLNQLTLILPDLKYDFPKQYDKWMKYLSDFDVNKNLKPLPEPSSLREKYYLASKNVLQLFYEIKAMEATHEKYFIRAPYNGFLSSSILQEGDMARAGQKLGTYIGSGVFEMQAAVQTSEINYLKKGMPVTLSEIKTGKKIEGKIVRINPAVSFESQSVYIYIQTRDKNVRDGAFYNVFIKINTNKKAVRIPKEAVAGDGKITIKTDDEIIRITPKIIDKSPRYYFIENLNDGDIILYDKF